MSQIVSNSLGTMVGNTDPIVPRAEKKQQGSTARHWCFTYNNYNKNDLVSLDSILNNICNKFVFQEEIGQEGTRHLQGYIELTNKKRLTGLKKINDKIHWENCNNIDASIAYCTDISKRKEYGQLRSKGIEEIYTGQDIPHKLINGWQSTLKQKLLTEIPNRREINWIYDIEGGKGKSIFCKYMAYYHNAITIDGGKGSDILYHISQCKNKKIVLIDIPRAEKNKICYRALESIKNGKIFSTKYECKSVFFEPPHLVVFSNYEPDYSTFSTDRWNVIKI